MTSLFQKIKKNEKGFTLLEALIAMVILAIGVLGFMAVHYQSVQGRLLSKNLNEAILAGNAYNERMISRGFEAVVGPDTAYQKNGGSDADSGDYSSHKANVVNRTTFNWDNNTTSQNPNTEIRQIRTLTLDVQWKKKGDSETGSTGLHTFLRND